MKFRVAFVTLSSANGQQALTTLRHGTAYALVRIGRRIRLAEITETQLSKWRSQHTADTHCSRYFARSGLVGLLVTTIGWLMLACACLLAGVRGGKLIWSVACVRLAVLPAEVALECIRRCIATFRYV